MSIFLLLFALAGDPELVAVPIARPGIGEPARVPYEGPVLVAMTSTTCPLSRKFAPVLARLSKSFEVVFVDVQGGDSRKDFERFAEQHGFSGTLVHDPERRVARSLGATTTTEVFLLDARRRLVYRGAVSDQYGVGVSHDAPRHAYLADAIEALRAGRQPPVVSTSAPGCALDLEAAAARSGVTWHGRVQHIVQHRCVECHRTGGVAPFPLETYEQVVDHAGMVGLTVRKGIMPPWFAAPGNGPFHNDRSLSDTEKRDLAAWLKGKLPKGDPRRAPEPRAWPERWTIGEPDRVFELPRPVEVKAEGRMDYVMLRLPTGLREDRWVRAWELRPTARDVVHHVLVFALAPGQERAPGGERGDFLAAFVPGNGVAVYPDGVAKKLPKGATLHFQLHYTPNGRATIDRTQLGMIFGGPPRHEVRTEGICNTRIRIPAGAADHEEFAGVPVPFDARVLGLMPHMHFRGKSFRYDLLTADGKRTTILDLPRYDFNWQLAYWFEQPLLVPKGSRLQVIARYDNSARNPANPDPARDVRWGEQSDDEMLIGYVEYYVPSLPAGQPVPKMRGTRADGMLAMLDRDGDGRISKRECPERLAGGFARLDADADGFVDRGELAAVNRQR